MPSFNEEFNAVSDKIAFTKESEVSLAQHMRIRYCDVTLVYDFAHRLLITATSGKSDHAQVTPFSELDPEVLVEMRNKLIALDGKPPSLPENAGKRSLIDKGPRS